jgi:hypothetical protein
METVTPQPSPFMETVQAKIEADEANIMHQPNSYFSPFMETVTPQPFPFMETVQAKIEADEANIMHQPNSYFSPFMETVRFEVELPRGKLEVVRAENQRLHIELGNSKSEKEFFRQEG